MKFGEKLRELRLKRGIMQEDLAKDIGVSISTYAGYERCVRYPRYRDVYTKLAAVLGCEVNYLLAEDEEFISDAAQKYGRRGKQQAQRLVEELSGMFASDELSDSDKDAVMIALQRAYFDCKEDNKKYTPKKARVRVRRNG